MTFLGLTELAACIAFARLSLLTSPVSVTSPPETDDGDARDTGLLQVLVYRALHHLVVSGGRRGGWQRLERAVVDDGLYAIDRFDRCLGLAFYGDVVDHAAERRYAILDRDGNTADLVGGQLIGRRLLSVGVAFAAGCQKRVRLRVLES